MLVHLNDGANFIIVSARVYLARKTPSHSLLCKAGLIKWQLMGAEQISGTSHMEYVGTQKNSLESHKLPGIKN